MDILMVDKLRDRRERPAFLAGVAQAAEHWPSKPEEFGSSPAARSVLKRMDAFWVE